MGTSHTVSVDTASTLLLKENTQRLSVLFSVVGDSGLFLAGDSTMTTSSGILISGGGGTLSEDSGGRNVYLGPYYGATSGSTTTDVRVWERERK